jgi:glycine C-acetyltransferase
MHSPYQTHLADQLASLRAAGLYKTERVLTTPQSAHVSTNTGREVINLCANNYLGLASHPEVIAAAHEALDRWGYGLSSVRFICGTQSIHQELEARLSDFLGTEDNPLFLLLRREWRPFRDDPR